MGKGKRQRTEDRGQRAEGKTSDLQSLIIAFYLTIISSLVPLNKGRKHESGEWKSVFIPHPRLLFLRYPLRNENLIKPHFVG
jgi:hypothetical protein